MDIKFQIAAEDESIEVGNPSQDDPLADKILALLDALVQVNLIWLGRNPAPLLMESGVVYKAERKGDEVWKDIPHVLLAMHGDCEDLVSYRVAELLFTGHTAKPILEKFPLENGDVYYHVLLEHGEGVIEDPSRALGMK